MSCCGGGGSCGKPPPNKDSGRYCQNNDLCCFLFKTMMDPCSKALDRNVRRNVYGQVNHCLCRSSCEPAGCCSDCPKPHPSCTRKPINIQFSGPTVSCPLCPSDGSGCCS